MSLMPASTTCLAKLHLLHNNPSDMLSINLHERQHLAAATPKHGTSSTPRPKVARSKMLLTQHMQIAHQRVNLEVNMAQRKLLGYTELTVVPTSSNLRVVRLDAREMKIKRVLVNGSRANYIHRDLLYINDPQTFDACAKAGTTNVWDLYSADFSIHQHHVLRQKLDYIFGEVSEDPLFPDRISNLNTEELAILLPDNLKLELTDHHAIHTPNSLVPPTLLTPLHLRLKNTQNEVYTPILIGIEYETINTKNGVVFSCDPAVEKKLWHAYTVNSEFHVSTSSWVPCVDNLIEKCTWSIELTIPRAIKNIGKTPRTTAQGTGDEPDEEANDGEDDEDDDSERYDLSVCTGDFNNTKESPHPTDLSQKIVSWSIFNPIAAHHLGWAIGAFQSTEITDLNDGAAPTAEVEEGAEEFEEIEKDASGSSVMLYYLPGQEELAKNTCIFAQEALEHFLKEFGSFPFSTYGITFVEGPRYPYNNFAGLTILSTEILYPPDVIEPMFSITENILECIAGQWSGINIVPQMFNDLWLTIGIAKFITFLFMRTLMGSNEFRYQIKKKMDRIVEEDVNKRPIGNQSFETPISESDLLFIRLKSPIILFILDRRMTKTDKSFGLSRVLPKLFLQVMSGDLQNGALSTLHFQSVCEKVNRNRLESFFKQWVWGTGAPIFNITQKFNKKRSMIEVVIRQSQLQQAKTPHPTAQTFVNDAVTLINDEVGFPTQQTFVGPMTIRVHEADGTPYEHIVDIKDTVVKFDVQYNTKFKRLKKNKDETGEGNPVFSKLGDTLQSDKDVEEWNLAEWPKRDEEFFDPFEWIRVDTDFEWIATFNVIQPDYMFGSQLQQDRDIEAQISAIEYFGNLEKPNRIYCTMLTRTLMDKRYFYGVRIAAAKALAGFSTSASKFIGLDYLIKAFTTLFCFANSYIPLGNSFEEFGDFFLQSSIPKFLAQVKDDDGNTPSIVKSLLFNLLKYNDNSNNDFQDCFYVADLVESLVRAVIPANADNKNVDMHLERELSKLLNSSEQKFLDKVLEEIERIQKLDRWVASYQSVVSFACIQQKIALARSNLYDLSFETLLYYTRKRYTQAIRILAFKGIFLLGGLKNSEIMSYFLSVCLLEDSTPEFRSKLIQSLVESISEAAIHGLPSMLDDPEFDSLEKITDTFENLGQQNNMVVIEESQSTEMTMRRDAFARATVKGAMKLLRRDLSVGTGLKMTLWELLHSALLSLHDKKLIFILCEILYPSVDSYLVRIPVPCVPFEELKKKIVAKNSGEGKVIIKREGRFKILLTTKILLSSSKAEPIRREPRDRAHSRAANRHVEEIPDEPPQPKLKIKVAQAAVSEPEIKAEPAPPRKRARTVTRDIQNHMQLKIRFTNHKLPPLVDKPEVTETPLVTVDSSNVTLRFISAAAKEKLRLFGKPNRYVRINLKKNSVAVAPEPFEDAISQEQAIEEETETAQKADNEVKDVEMADANEVASEKEKVAEPEKSEPVEATPEPPAPIPQLPAVKSRESLEGAERDGSRAASPFASDDSSGKPAKRKKTKIYIHSNNSRTPSPAPATSATEPLATEPKAEEAAEPPKPKLKLKLSLK